MLAIGGTTGVEIVDPSSKLCAAPANASFADDVMPIFKGYCFGCHQPDGAGDEKSGLDLTTHEGVIKGTKFGRWCFRVIPTPDLMWLLDWRGAPATHMPLGKKQLSSCERDTIRAWIREGAKNN